MVKSFNVEKNVSLTLELKPEVETSLRSYAQAQGVSVEELLSRTFPPRPLQSHRQPPTPKALAMAATISQWQAEDEAEQTDDEAELERRDRERAEHEANLDAPRRQAGMRLLFPGPE